MRAQFGLDPAQHFFNTGTLGSCPRVVHHRVVETLRQLDARPTYHYWARCMPRYLELRRKAVALLGVPDPGSVTLTHSTTEGINIVARGLDLRAGDEVLMIDHEHPGGESIWRRLESEIGIRVRRCHLPMRPPGDQRILESIATSSWVRSGSCAGPGS